MNPATRFFSAMMGRYPADESLRLEIRCLPPAHAKDREGRPPRQWYTLAPDYLANAAAACEHWGKEWDVYFSVLPRQGRTGSQNDVVWAHTLFCDVDGGDEGVPGAIARIKASGIDLPDMAVQSGGGIHAYWLLDAPIVLPDRESRESYKRTLRRICLAIGGASPAAHADPAACEVARILRVPGTFNHKQEGNPRPVKILRQVLSVPPFSRSYDWWRSHLPAEPMQPGPKAQPGFSYAPGAISPGLEAWAKRGYAEGSRNKRITSDAAWLVRDVKLTKDQARTLLQMKAAASPGQKPFTAEELEGIVKWA